MHTAAHLNPQQFAAVQHVEGPLLVIAGAGSGKTRVVTYRIIHLLELGVPASEILAVTFTNKAAEEMRQRVLNLASHNVLTCTFHSLGARILRECISYLGYASHFTIFDEEDSEKVLKECLALLNVKEDKGFFKTVRGQISQAKNLLQEPSSLSTEDPFLARVYELYQSKLKEYNAVDFDDLLFLTVKLFQESEEVLKKYQERWAFILIDEYQDTNHAQSTMIKLLAEAHHNVFAVGDPDQSIYSWRGADVQNILSFEKDYPGAKVISLEQNYRSRNNILQAANSLIEHNPRQYEKKLWSERGEGEKIGLFISESEQLETEFVLKKLLTHHDEDLIPFSECVIFYRTNFQSRVFEDALLRHRIPYVVIGGLSFYQRKEIKDILAFLRLILGSPDFLSFSRAINLPKRGFGEATLEKLRTFSQENNQDVFSTSLLIVQGKLSFKLSQRQFEGLKDFVATILSLREELKKQLPLNKLLMKTIESIGYFTLLKEDPETYQERKENIEELLSKAAEWEEETGQTSLTSFLEELSLKSSHEEKDATKDAVRLMTIHNGKGLEFSAVFLVGMEEDLFPHINCKDLPQALEEERRLCYVGMTRAKDYLYLSASRYRFLWGGARFMRPSRFLQEIPSEYLQAHHSSYSKRTDQAVDFEPDEITFQPGDTVSHRDFGVGIVQKTYQTSLGLTYDVLFTQTNKIRSLVAKFAKLLPY